MMNIMIIIARNNNLSGIGRCGIILFRKRLFRLRGAHRQPSGVLAVLEAARVCGCGGGSGGTLWRVGHTAAAADAADANATFIGVWDRAHGHWAGDRNGRRLCRRRWRLFLVFHFDNLAGGSSGRSPLRRRSRRRMVGRLSGARGSIGG